MKKLLLIALMLCGAARAQDAIVYFDFDSYALTDKTKAVLDSTFSSLTYYRAVKVDMMGYTDDQGTVVYNDTLALRRATAVRNYLKIKYPQIDGRVFKEKVYGNLPEGLSDTEERCVRAYVRDDLVCWYDPNYEARYQAGNGVEVIAFIRESRQNPHIPTIITSFSAEEMLANNRFGIDTDGNILKSWGMIDIKGGESEDGYYTVRVPIDGAPDTGMSIWLPDDEMTQGVPWRDNGSIPFAPISNANGNTATAGNGKAKILKGKSAKKASGDGRRNKNTPPTANGNAGNVRWKDTDVKISIDSTGKYYEFRVPVSTSGNTRINLDKPCGFADDKRFAANNGQPIRYKTIYLSTLENYNFYNVGIGSKNNQVRFSAKINDTLYAFTVPYKAKTQRLSFSGWQNGQEKALTFRLARCKFKQDKQNNVYYTMTNRTLQEPQKRKTGFWAWVSRQFKNS
jgi:hypothetical protein